MTAPEAKKLRYQSMIAVPEHLPTSWLGRAWRVVKRFFTSPVSAWVAIVASLLGAQLVETRAISSANGVQKRSANAAASLQRKSINAQEADQRSAGAATASVYLARVQLERKGLVAMWNQNRTLEPYAPISGFNLPVADGVALQVAKAPSRTIGDLGRFYGLAENAYRDLLPEGIARKKPLSGGARRLICQTLGFADQLAKDLEKTKHVVDAAGTKPTLADPHYSFTTGNGPRRHRVDKTCRW